MEIKISRIIKFLYVSICVLVGVCCWSLVTKQENKFYKNLEKASLEKGSPVSLKTYYLIEKYSKKYNIPKHIAYNIAYLETSYKGPFDWKYNPFLSSSAGAVGPMQVMVSTAKYVNKKTVSSHTLKNDLELNISTSMKLLNILHSQYDDWGIVCGYYNTGYPKINGYATFCISNKDYNKNWIYY
jgi:hypothetical protein